MTQIELRERFFGPGLVGTVDVAPASETRWLQQAFVDAAERTATEVAGVSTQLTSLGWTLDAISSSVWNLERQLSQRLDAQTQLLASQLGALRSIDEALRTPAKVRAAERMADSAQLLVSRRYERALQCASEAIDGDPSHPGGFVAAGWAHAGLGDMAAAAAAFAEAHEAAAALKNGKWRDAQLDYARFAGRCLLVNGEAVRARDFMERARTRAPEQCDPSALDYDLALACILAGDEPAAAAHIGSAVKGDVRFAQLAVAEPLFEHRATVVAAALAAAREVADAAAELEQSRSERVALLRAALSDAFQQIRDELNAAGRAASESKLASEWQVLDGRRKHEERAALRIFDDAADLAGTISDLEAILASTCAVRRDVVAWATRLDTFVGGIHDLIQREGAELTFLKPWHAQLSRTRFTKRRSWTIYTGADGAVYQLDSDEHVQVLKPADRA